MHMFYISPGRALQDFQGINTGPLWKKWSIMKNNGRQIERAHLSFVSFLF